MQKINVNDKVIIRSKESWANKEWGIVKAIENGTYFIAIANDNSMQLVFDRKELRKVQ